MERIPAPLPDIAVNVMQAPRVRLLLTDFVCIAAAVIIIPRIIAYLQYAVRNGNIANLNTFSIKPARQMISLLRAHRLEYSIQSAGENASTSISFANNLLTERRKAKTIELGIDREILTKQNKKNVKMGLGATALMGAGAAGGILLGIAGQLGLAAASAAVGVKGVEKSEIAEWKKKISKRSLIASAMGAGGFIVGGGYIAIPALMAVGALTPKSLTHKLINKIPFMGKFYSAIPATK